jgi:hypothetical protein
MGRFPLVTLLVVQVRGVLGAWVLSPISPSLHRLRPSHTRVHAERRSLRLDEDSAWEPYSNEDSYYGNEARVSLTSPSSLIGADVSADFYSSNGIQGDPNGASLQRLSDLDLETERDNRSSPSIRRRPSPYSTNYYEPQENDDYVEGESGNFWTNPAAGLDYSDDDRRLGYSRRNDPQQQQQQQYRPRGKRSKSTIRSLEPQPPAPVVDLYNRLFWYGFGDDNNDDGANGASVRGRDDGTADRTMFGGTKGKFNGLAFLNAGLDSVPEEKRPRYRNQSSSSSTERRGDNERFERYYDDDERELDYDDDVDPRIRSNQQSMRGIDSNGREYPRPMVEQRERRQRPMSESSSRQAQQPPRRRMPDQGDWVTNTVSSWFGPNVNDDDDLDDNEDEYYNGGGPRQRRQRRADRDGTPSWSPLSALDTFFGLDRNQLQDQATAYNMQMGLPSTKRPGRSDEGERGRARSRPAPPRAEDSWELEEPPRSRWSPAETASAPNVVGNQELENDRVIDTEPILVQDRANAKAWDMTWEERALAVERVPPANIGAWGPPGDLGMDARTKAVTDAVEDVQSAQVVVDEWERQIAADKDELAILRIDVELERKQWQQQRAFNNGAGSQTMLERLRVMDRQVDDMARRLRYSILQRDLALDDLNELKARHWALLSFYDPNQAEEAVAEMWRELQETEPAVRQYMNKIQRESVQ